jgi:phosphoglycerate dehydrogenase-like enzyme
MTTTVRRVALSWRPSEEELQLVRASVAGDVEFRYPDEREIAWNRFACSPDVLARLMLGAEALIGWAAPTRKALSDARRLKFIAWLHAGCDQLDLPWLAERGVQVANVRGANGTVVAEHAVALVLGLAKRIRQNDQAAREVRWQGWWDPSVSSVELEGRTACVLGFGNVGRRIVPMCRGFGIRVLAVRRSGGVADTGDAEVVVGGPDDAQKFIGAADFVVVAMPLTPETRGYFDAERLSWLKPGAYLVNVGRGDIVQERAVFDALVAGRLAGFASDVWWNYADEMPPGYHFATPSRLGVHRLPNVLASTDSAANIVAVKERMIGLGAESLGAFVAGREIPRLVNPTLGY